MSLNQKKTSLFIAHGSRESKGNDSLWSLLDRFQKKYPDDVVAGAFLELALPLIPEAIDQCVKEGATKIVVIPLMMFEGRHVGRDIPQIVGEAIGKYPDVIFEYAGALADDDTMLELMKGKMKLFF